MANKGTIITSFYRSGTGYMLNGAYEEGQSTICNTILDWSIKSQDVVNGSSVIAWKLIVDCETLNDYDSDAEYIKVGGAVTVRCGSSATSGVNTTLQTLSIDQIQINKAQQKEIASGEFTVAHNSTGAKTLYSFCVNAEIVGVYDEDGTSVMNISSYGKALNGLSATVILDTIAKHGVIYTAPNFNDEESPVLTYGIPKESTAAWVGIMINGTMMVPYRSVAVTSSSYKFTLTQTEKAALWTILAQGLSTAEARFYIKTTCNGNTLESVAIRTLTFINYMPTLSPTITEANDDVYNRLTGNRNKLVRYVSNAAFTTGGSAKKGASIDVQTTTNNGIPLDGPSGTFEKVTSNKFTFDILDTYGRAERVEKTLAIPTEWVEYVKLTCSVDATPMTADGDVQVTITGKCFTGDFGKITNRLRVNYDIAKNNGDWDHVDLGYATNASMYGNSFVVNGSDYTYTLNITGLEYLNVYDLTIRVSDEVSVEGVPAQTILAAVPIFDWSRTDFNFNVPVTIEGASVPTIVGEGTSGIWTYRKWSDGTAECWGKKDVSVTFPSSANWGGLFTTSAISASNISFPSGLFLETPVITASLLIRSVGGILMAPGGSGSNIASKDRTGVYEIARGSYVSGSQAFTINYDVKGKWK